MSKLVHVAAGVIRNADGSILIAKRPDHTHQGGLWEFPGGKLEAGETAQQALARELYEELGICATVTQPLIQIRHDYPDKSVLLDVWWVDEFTGEPHGREGQPVRWVAKDNLGDYDFPAANAPIVTAAQLPQILAITPECETSEQWVSVLSHLLQQGVGAIQLRQPSWNDNQWLQALTQAASVLKVSSVELFLNSPPLNILNKLEGLEIAESVAGIHLNSQLMQQMIGDMAAENTNARLTAYRRFGWLSASCHNAQELELAQALNLDFVTLSPVTPTQTHPQAQPLGWSQFADWVASAKMPVYALGGMQLDDVQRAINHGGQGIAAIRAWD